jgi:hypothetical protein
MGVQTGIVPETPAQTVDPALQQTIELLTQALSLAGHGRDPSLSYADQARRIGATEFNGEGDPVVVEEWIEKMERIMEVMDIPQERRVVLATFFLSRNARFWWESVKKRYVDPSTITWQMFRSAFDDQFYPVAYQNMNMEEFL